jgi:hypothetical protein
MFNVSPPVTSPCRFEIILLISLGIGESEWAFKTTFTVTEAELAAPHVDIVFEGIDTFAFIKLVRYTKQSHF